MKKKMPLLVLLLACLVLVIARTYFLGSAQIYGTSMAPTLEPGDRILYLKILFSIDVGDIVCVTNENNKQLLVKRVAGVMGDTIQIIGNDFRVNDKTLCKVSSGDEFCQKIPVGHIFLIGDNTDFSNDSRDFGPVSVGKVKGVVIMKIRPLGLIHSLNTTDNYR